MRSRVLVSIVFGLFSFEKGVPAKLVVDIDNLDDIDANTIEKEATLVETVIKETDCEGVTDTVRVFEYFVNENGKEERETAELVSRNLNVEAREFHSKNESWIRSTVFYRPALNCLDQDDPTLVSTMQLEYLLPPSTEEYNISMIPSPEPKSFSQFSQDMFLDEFIFKGEVKEGFFIEAGADDFVLDSNTLWFEMKHKWTGVLVEPNPIRLPKGVFANRKAWGAPFCLATQTRPHFSPFSQSTVEGGMSGLVPEHVKGDVENMFGSSYDLQCLPLYTLMLAMGNPTINLFILDIEGAEFQVLQSLPWDKVDIEVLAIELKYAGKVFPGTRKEVHQFLFWKDYEYVGTVGIDDVFVRTDLSQGKYKIDIRAAKEFEFYEFYDPEDEIPFPWERDEL